MTRICLAFLVGAVCLLALNGCDKNAGIRDELFRIRDKNKAEMDILKKRNEMLNRELNDLKEIADKLRDSNDRLALELTNYSTRPDQVKLEIITEVNTRFDALAKSQQAFIDAANQNFADLDTLMKADLQAGLKELDETLVENMAFIRFVTGEQDSINYIFASRFDSRPWYQSILGKWEDMERKKTGAKTEEAP